MRTEQEKQEENRILLKAEEMGTQSLSPQELEKLESALHWIREAREIKKEDNKSVPLDAVVSKILAGYDAYLADSKDFDSRGEAKAYVEAKQADSKITDHVRFYSMEMSSNYMLIVYEDENDNQYFANSGIVPNKIKKVGTAGDNLIYMVIER